MHCNTGYSEYLEPSNSRGWRVVTEPLIKSIQDMDFDVSVDTRVSYINSARLLYIMYNCHYAYIVKKCTG